MELIKCKRCNKPITNKTEVEYSQELTSYFCNFNCATDYYFDYMRSIPFQFEKEEMEEKRLVLKNGKLYEVYNVE